MRHKIYWISWMYQTVVAHREDGLGGGGSKGESERRLESLSVRRHSQILSKSGHSIAESLQKHVQIGIVSFDGLLDLGTVSFSQWLRSIVVQFAVVCVEVKIFVVFVVTNHGDLEFYKENFSKRS